MKVGEAAGWLTARGLFLALALCWPSTSWGQGVNDTQCTFDRDPTWRYVVGRGQGAETEATQQARDAAESDLMATVGAGLPPLRRDGLLTQVVHWFDKYDPPTQTACAVVSIPADARQKLDAEAGQLEQAVAGLAGAVADKTPGLLAIDDIAWDTGCGAGEVGHYLRTSLYGHLARFPGIRIDASDEPAADASHLCLNMAEVSGEVLITALLTRSGQVGSEPLEGFRFTSSLLGIEPTSGACCATDDMLGIENGGRTGISGLTVEFVLLGKMDVYCEGNQIEPVISVSQPARVQVFNVQKDGMAQLIWPSPGDAGVVKDRVSMGQVTLIASSGREDERLVAVAVPETSRFARSDEWWAYCEVPDTFGQHYFPPGAAVGTTTFTVVPQGRRGCPNMAVGGAKETQVQARPCER